MTEPRPGTWGAPNLPTGLDQFTARQQPDVHPVDDLSRFVMDRIIATEAEPKTEVPQVYGQPAGPIAHRYAKAVRRDMVVFGLVTGVLVVPLWECRGCEDCGPMVLDGRGYPSPLTPTEAAIALERERQSQIEWDLQNEESA